jgi:hypothetical protein
MIRTLSLLCLSLILLPGCFVFIDDVDHDHEDEDVSPPPEPNYDPEIDRDGTWWLCDYDEIADDYFFEFQAVVDDWNGEWDVTYVEVTIFEAGWDYQIDGFSLIHEQDNTWGGLAWERESELFCGEPIDVLFEAWDYDGAYDTFMLYY